MNVRIYICDQYIRIFEYIRHTLWRTHFAWHLLRDGRTEELGILVGGCMNDKNVIVDINSFQTCTRFTHLLSLASLLVFVFGLRRTHLWRCCSSRRWRGWRWGCQRRSGSSCCRPTPGSQDCSSWNKKMMRVTKKRIGIWVTSFYQVSSSPTDFLFESGNLTWTWIPALLAFGSGTSKSKWIGEPCFLGLSRYSQVKE